MPKSTRHSLAHLPDLVVDYIVSHLDNTHVFSVVWEWSTSYRQSIVCMNHLGKHYPLLAAAQLPCDARVLRTKIREMRFKKSTLILKQMRVENEFDYLEPFYHQGTLYALVGRNLIGSLMFSHLLKADREGVTLRRINPVEVLAPVLSTCFAFVGGGVCYRFQVNDNVVTAHRLEIEALRMTESDSISGERITKIRVYHQTGENIHLIGAEEANLMYEIAFNLHLQCFEETASLSFPNLRNA